MTKARRNNTTRLTSQASARVEVIDPDTARAWLAANTHNRNIRPGKVERYARDIARGGWEMTGEAIKFATDGTLLDGQHRLRAVVAANTPLTSLVVRGLENHTQDVMDTGATRRAADALALAGKQNGGCLAAAAKIGVMVGDQDRPTRQRGVSLSNKDLFDYIDNHPGIEDASNWASGELRKKVRLPVSVMAYCVYRLSCLDGPAAEEFFESLATRANLPLGSPILTLANRLDRIALDRQSLTNYEAIWLVFRSWNAWRAGESLQKLMLPDDVSAFPKLKG